LWSRCYRPQPDSFALTRFPVQGAGRTAPSDSSSGRRTRPIPCALPPTATKPPPNDAFSPCARRMLPLCWHFPLSLQIQRAACWQYDLAGDRWALSGNIGT